MSGTTGGGTVIGSGSDSIVLNMSEDQAAGQDAQFTVNVDGQQIGGIQTVTASHADGQDQTFTFKGDYAPGQHNVTVTFVNNFLYPGTSGDRNVYVDGVSYDGQTVSNTTTPIYQSPLFPPNSTDGNIYGNATFGVNDTTAIPNGAGPNPTTTPGAVSVGSGADTIVLNMAEDPYQGDAKFTVSVDGQQVGGTQTTTAVVSEGQQQEFDVHGNFGGGDHTVTVTFLNDKVGGYYPQGTPGLPPGQWALDTADRNLYVMGVNMNGGPAASGAPWELSSDGSESFNVTAGNNQSVGSSSATSGSSSTASTSNTATITSSSLTAGQTSSGSGSSTGTSSTGTSSTGGSSSGMSFIASPNTTTTASGGSNNTSSGSNSTSSGGAGNSPNTTTTIASATGNTSQSTQDFTVPSTTGSSGSGSSNTGSSGTDTSGASTSGTGNWWTHHHAGGSGTWTPAHSGG